MHYLLALSTLLTALGIDRLSKLWIQSTYALGSSAPLTPFLSLSYRKNTGVSFSLLSEFGAESPVAFALLIGSVIVGLLYIWHRFSSHTRLSDCAHGMLIGGAISNFIDRLMFGGVIDFIDLHYCSLQIPIFNCADVAIVCGFLLLMGEMYYESDQR